MEVKSWLLVIGYWLLRIMFNVQCSMNITIVQPARLALTSCTKCLTSPLTSSLTSLLTSVILILDILNRRLQLGLEVAVVVLA